MHVHNYAILDTEKQEKSDEYNKTEHANKCAYYVDDSYHFSNIFLFFVYIYIDRYIETNKRNIG